MSALRESPGAAALLPFSFARRHGVILTGRGGDVAHIAHRPAPSQRILSELRRHLAMPLVLEQVPDERFDALLTEVYEMHTGTALEGMRSVDEDLDLRAIAKQLEDPRDLLDSDDAAPIIRLINGLFAQAAREGASDIHVEPFEQRLLVRFRVDGMLREVIEPPRALAPLIVSRIKVMAGLDIAEKRVPQDGRTTLRVAGRPVDVRVSTIPSGHGERVVLRLLHQRRIALEQLGLEAERLAVLDALVRLPHGIILVTGPTGSGKTTTLYSVLERLNDRTRNIMTVEEPIEYYLDGVGQTQVNTRTEMGFARGLRAILRQDPDIVMVGEIRDAETARIAVQASLTGHLVLSTLHTNTAVGAVMRLRDMGVEPFLLSSSLVGVLAQRLMRVLCAHCKRAHQADGGECELLGAAAASPPTLYDAPGCEQCGGTGFRGRTGVFELIRVDEALARMIHDGAPEHELTQHARSLTPGLRDDGLRLVTQGVTSLSELLRVIH